MIDILHEVGLLVLLLVELVDPSLDEVVLIVLRLVVIVVVNPLLGLLIHIVELLLA